MIYSVNMGIRCYRNKKQIRLSNSNPILEKAKALFCCEIQVYNSSLNTFCINFTALQSQIAEYFVADYVVLLHTDPCQIMSIN